MDIIIFGSKTHPYTIKILTEFEKRKIPIKALIQKRRLTYPPELVFQTLGGEGFTRRDLFSKRIFNLDNLTLAIHNPLFALQFLRHSLFTKIDSDSQRVHQYKVKSQFGEMDLSGLRIENVDNYNSKRAVKLLQQIGPDLIILGPAAQIVKGNILSIPRLGTLSSHPGMLPKYRGMHPIEYAIVNGAELGVTTYFVDNGVDTGDILLKRRLKVTKGMTLDDIESQTIALMVESLADAVQMIENGNYARKPQDLAAGKQYYCIHPVLRELAQQRLRQGNQE